MIHLVWNAVLYRPIINLLAFLISVIPGGDVGVAIVLLTIIVKTILYPISKKGIDGQIKSAEMQAKINKIAPEIDKIKKSGASREEQARLTMELHKKHDIDTFAALSGCLVQIPILIVIFALYAAFRSGMNFDNGILYSFIHAPAHVNTVFLGMIDITKRSLVLAALGALSQYIVALSMPKPPVSSDNSFSSSLNKSMGWQMKYFFPVFIFVILGTNVLGISLSGSIALYYITNNLFTAAQQAYEGRKRNMLILAQSLE